MRERLFVVEAAGSANCPGNSARRIYNMKGAYGDIYSKEFTFAQVNAGVASTWLTGEISKQASVVSTQDVGGGCVNTSRFDPTRPGSQPDDLRQFATEEEMRKWAIDHDEQPRRFSSGQEANAYVSAFVNKPPLSNTDGEPCGCSTCPCPQPGTDEGWIPGGGLPIPGANEGGVVHELPGQLQPFVANLTLARFQAFIKSPLGMLVLLAAVVWFALHLSPRKTVVVTT